MNAATATRWVADIFKPTGTFPIRCPSRDSGTDGDLFDKESSIISEWIDEVGAHHPEEHGRGHHHAPTDESHCDHDRDHDHEDCAVCRLQVGHLEDVNSISLREQRPLDYD